MSGDIFITPPDGEISEEDSGDEESVNINHLSRGQLLAEAEYRATISSKGGVQYVHDVTNENESFEFSVASASTAKPPTKRRRIDVTRKWKFIDIPEKEEKVTEYPYFLENRKSCELFRIIF